MDLSPAASAHYEIESVLGRGAMGVVYAARDRRIGRRVALKTLQIPERQFEDSTAMKEYFQRLQREAELCGSLLHPNIVALYDVGYDNERISYLAMELVDGETLQQTLEHARPQPLPLDFATRVAADVLRGLVHAHAKGVIHRDIKPANVLVATDDTAKIADFGIARPQKSSLTAAGALIGTPNYMSPEQVLGQPVTTRSDIFSTGVMLYEMLSGIKPFAAHDLTGILHNILKLDPPHLSTVNPRVPRAYGDYVARLMSKNPDQRPETADALKKLQSLAAVKPRDTRIRALPLTLATIAILIAIITALFFVRSRIDVHPTVTIPPEQLAQFDEKRRALGEADALFHAGRFEESRQRYESYLAKYPNSRSAEEGRDKAMAALAQSKRPQPKRSPARASAKKDEDISPREMLDRIKRVFRH